MKVGKDGRVSVNVRLSLKDARDSVILEFLEGKYSATGYVKEVLYALATGENIGVLGINNSIKTGNYVDDRKVVEDEEEQEFEKINTKGLEGILG